MENQHKPKKIMKKPSLAKKILVGLGTGVGIALVLSSPYGSRKLIRNIKSELFRKKGINEEYLKNQLYYLRRKKLISFKEKGSETIIELSEHGKKYILKYKYDDIKINKPLFWDRKWRIVVFDIPEKRRSARDAMRIKLKELGLIKFNDSVWIYPYECREEIYFVTEFWKIGQYVHYIEATSITNENQIRRIFNIPLTS
jgi:DNA-binding transcriptional regulator PaaX